MKGGSFAVPELGTEYTGLDTQLEFTGNAMRIKTFTLVDENGEIMRVGGELSVHERQLGTFQVNVETENGRTVPCVIFLDRVEDAGGITCDWSSEG